MFASSISLKIVLEVNVGLEAGVACSMGFFPAIFLLSSYIHVAWKMKEAVLWNMVILNYLR